MSQIPTKLPEWGAPPGPPKPPRKHRISRLGWVAIAVVLVVVGIIAAVNSGGGTTSSTQATTPASQATLAPATTQPTPTTAAVIDPQTVVESYFRAINAQDYGTAWDAGGKNLEESFGAFVAGFNDTKHVDVKFTGTSGNQLAVRLVATAIDGTKTTYGGTYTVKQGIITGAQITKVVPPKPKPKPVPAAPVFNDGVYKVGIDIQPGLYRTLVVAGMGYWARLGSEDTTDIIANDIKDSGPMYVRVHASDKYIEFSGGNDWKKVG
ncbi:MAG TPA: hypothetical protein VFA45_08705 [Actinomycetes bacterium]|jgi:hypothetical protein|nr:hypothetical protein [Actinomycetes bacterium]